MQVGLAADSARSYLDYPSLAEAEADSAYALRQDIRLLPNLFDIGIHEYARLVRENWVDPTRITHFLCHYSSQRFAPVVCELLEKAGLAIPAERWYSNLTARGNTGAASIFVMLDDFLRERTVHPGEQILCIVPESGRFTVGYVLLEVIGAAAAETENQPPQTVTPMPPASRPTETPLSAPPPPHDPASAPAAMRPLLRELADAWHDYRSRAWRTPIISRLVRGAVTLPDMLRWMEHWIPQVQQGSIWMRKALANLDERHATLRDLIAVHADDEQHDFKTLFADYRRAGGAVQRLEDLRRNPGGEALNAYLHALAERSNPIGLLGAIYVIEGTGQRFVPILLPEIRRRLALPLAALRFLRYHGENDVHHLARWLECVRLALEVDGGAVADDIVITARHTAQLYLIQLEAVG